MLRALGWLFLIVVLACGGVAFWGWNDYQSFLQQQRSIPTAAQSFTVNRGWSAKRVANEFTKLGIIDKPHWFELYARSSQLAPSIKSGEFRLPETATVPELLDVLVAGRTVQYSYTIIEGHAWRQAWVRWAASGRLIFR